jgi:hypothetical protein
MERDEPVWADHVFSEKPGYEGTIEVAEIKIM